MLDFSGSDHPDAELIEEARMAAGTDWEEQFVADILARIRRNPGYSLSVAQRAKLEAIAYEA
jgi:hypothetical protein